MNYRRPTYIERAAGGVLDDDLRRGKRLVKLVAWSIVAAITITLTGFALLVMVVTESAKRLMGQ